MLTLPIYIRGNTYYFHTRIFGKQVKKSLHTNDKQTAIIKALSLLRACQMAIDSSNFPAYKIDIKNGLLEADGEDDHKNMMEALALMKSAQVPQTPAQVSPQKSGLKLLEVLDKMWLLNDQHKPATVLAYKNAVNEFSAFISHPYINDVIESDITRYQEFLAITKKNSTRTIDNKVAIVRALFNFAIKQKYCFIKNPAELRTIVNKKEHKKSGYAIFELPEMKKIFDSDYMRTAKIKDPDYYWCLVIAAFSGARISEITSLTDDQLQEDDNKNFFIKIRESKTVAGERDIPLPTHIFNSEFGKFIKDKTKLFKYQDRLGKGSGNAVSQKFKRHMQECGISRPKLVFHSIRKFFNDYLFNNDVALEPRCYIMGHEIENVNVELYRNTITVDKLAKTVSPIQ